jgi:hypothetical protein
LHERFRLDELIVTDGNGEFCQIFRRCYKTAAGSFDARVVKRRILNFSGLRFAITASAIRNNRVNIVTTKCASFRRV